MDRIRLFKRRLHRYWRNFRDSVWRKEPNGDYFRELDFMWAVAASRFEPKTPRQQSFWKWYRWFCLFHTCYASLNAIEHLNQWDDFDSTVWYIMIALEAVMGHVKDVILNKHSELITNAQDYINGRSTFIIDNCFDTNARKKYFRYIQVMCMAIFLITCLQQVILMVPNSELEKLYITPNAFELLGPEISVGLHYLFRLTLAPIWAFKIICSTAFVTTLLAGYATEFDVFTNGLSSTMDRVLADIEEHPTTSNALKTPQQEEMFFKYFKLRVDHHIMHHQELLQNIQQFQPFVEVLFFVIYYHAMILIGTYIFVLLRVEISTASVMLVSAICAYLIKCYCWCHVINSFQDINEEIELQIMGLITAMPHSKKHHSDYVGLRSTLMIMKMYTRESLQFSCGGIFNISVEVFGKLLNTTYSVLTFLLNVNSIRKA